MRARSSAAPKTNEVSSLYVSSTYKPIEPGLKGGQQIFHRHEQMQIMIFELREAALSVKRHGIPVDRMHYDYFESDMPGRLRDLG